MGMGIVGGIGGAFAFSTVWVLRTRQLLSFFKFALFIGLGMCMTFVVTAFGHFALCLNDQCVRIVKTLITGGDAKKK